MQVVPTPFEALKAAVQRAGSQSEFARICGVSQTAVWKWLQSSKRLPAERVLKVEQVTGVSRHHLRPDIYPAEPSSFPPCDDPSSSVGPGIPIVPCDRGVLLHRSEAA